MPLACASGQQMRDERRAIYSIMPAGHIRRGSAAHVVPLVPLSLARARHSRFACHAADEAACFISRGVLSQSLEAADNESAHSE